MFVLLLALSLLGCGNGAVALSDVFPGPDAVLGWAPSEEAQLFDRENLFDLVNGQAEAYFVYAFEQVSVQRYQNAAGAKLDIDVWQVATPADACGLFLAAASGEEVAIGNGGDTYPGWIVAFWQERYYVRVRAMQELPDAEIRRFAELVAAELPQGGECPDLLERLPSAGQVAHSALYFHEEISIQDDLWLGGENILGLSPETDGVLARYELDGVRGVLLLVQYPDAGAADAGLEALQASPVDDLVTADVREGLLGAVFGEVDEAAAAALLQEALADR